MFIRVWCVNDRSPGKTGPGFSGSARFCLFFERVVRIQRCKLWFYFRQNNRVIRQYYSSVTTNSKSHASMKVLMFKTGLF